MAWKKCWVGKVEPKPELLTARAIACSGQRCSSTERDLFGNSLKCLKQNFPNCKPNGLNWQ
ncbi:hypothetical protein BMETH_1239_1 [methanotrophic bacterial endosymbiont of Bathymodiolus sp.]|nr:hypothetical protein BMETH_1239_1 [methanotrophic bacterial endosymbiont of Bathymodiolus sp.]